MEKVKLENLNRGAVSELFEAEFQKILENIEDKNTPAGVVRSITIKLALTPDETRKTAKTRLSVTSKLAPFNETKGLVFLDRENGEPAAFEDNPGQTALNFEKHSTDRVPVNFGD